MDGDVEACSIQQQGAEVDIRSTAFIHSFIHALKASPFLLKAHIFCVPVLCDFLALGNFLR